MLTSNNIDVGHWIVKLIWSGFAKGLQQELEKNTMLKKFGDILCYNQVFKCYIFISASMLLKIV